MCPGRVCSVVTRRWESAAADRPSFDELSASLAQDEPTQLRSTSATPRATSGHTSIRAGETQAALQMSDGCTGVSAGGVRAATTKTQTHDAVQLSDDGCVPATAAAGWGFGGRESANERLVPSVDGTNRGAERERGSPVVDDAGCLTPSADDARRSSAASSESAAASVASRDPAHSQPPGRGTADRSKGDAATATVVDALWHRDHDLAGHAATNGAEDAGGGPLQETSFDATNGDVLFGVHDDGRVGELET